MGQAVAAHHADHLSMRMDPIRRMRPPLTPPRTSEPRWDEAAAQAAPATGHGGRDGSCHRRVTAVVTVA
ncbi:hypothetical protein ACFRAQ_11760 [Nocardia sp. NPDC056611]|uniref:hypothetical protein n=1 Tax=Nocardia sp. NPDC056611 TaxID=3345877 RepID=UPI00366D8E9A